MNKKNIIGIDFGGTNIRGACVQDNGEVLKRERIRTESSKGYEIVLKNLNTLIKRLITKDTIGIGIGFPGTVSENGKIIIAPNLGWKEVELKKELEEKYGIDVIIDNDVNMALCGEKWLGSGKEYNNIFMLTVGTGVGGSFFINGNIYGGINNNAGEIGHINIEKNGILCPCGGKGCLEQYASATALIRNIKERLPLSKDNDIEAEYIFNKAKEGQGLYLDAVNNMCEDLARGISTVVNLMNPQCIIIGGGVSHAGDFFLNKVIEYVKKYSLEYSFKDLDIKLASLGDEAGIFGGVYRIKIKKSPLDV